MSEVRKHIVFHGRVQGVGFRYTAKYLAQSLGLVGLNHGQFITIEWMDTKEIPLKEEHGFKVRG